MQDPLRVLFIASEADPLIKVGGLGDVAGSLPQAIRRLGQKIDIRLAIPFHSAIDTTPYQITPLASFSIPNETGPIEAQVYQTELDGLPVYLIGGTPFPPGVPVYSSDWVFDAHKYIFFSLAALELARRLGWPPRVLHANDWHTAAAVYAIALRRAADPFFAATRTLLSLHNLPYLGVGGEAPLRAFGLPPAVQSALPPWAQSLPLPLGLLSADRILAVSPGYAAEILTPEFGSGLDQFLESRKSVIGGILNGLDTQRWDPVSDGAVVSPFSAEKLSARAANKTALQQEVDLPVEPSTPLLAMITRMDYQKGVDITLSALRLLADRPWQAVLLGTGLADLETSARQLEADFPDRVRAVVRFDAALSRRIYAGADLLLMPSRYEPCGLAQMIAMRYGCAPLARATGGLRDTIRDDSVAGGATGFLFADATPEAMAGALRRAMDVYSRPRRWKALQRRGMAQDFSWQKSARAYVGVYRSLAGMSSSVHGIEEMQ